MGKNFFILIIFCLLMGNVSVFAKPLSDQQIEELSVGIIQGKVVRIHSVKEDEWGALSGIASIKVLKVLKGAFENDVVDLTYTCHGSLSEEPGVCLSKDMKGTMFLFSTDKGEMYIGRFKEEK